MLTPHQQEKFWEVMALLNGGKRRIIVQGLAGVGKTVLIGELVRYMSDGMNIIYVTAPTNKALAILREKVNVFNPVEFKTIHSALELKRDINQKTGDISFLREKGVDKRRNKLEHAAICFIDEASMLEIGIERHLDGYGHLPIIYIGDNHQLNPVREEESIIFSKGYPTIELTEIIRQEAGNPIIELSRDLEMIYFKIPKLINGKGYLYDDDRVKIISNLAEVNGTDDLKYLAYTNEEVNRTNNAVRKKRYGNPAKIELEEALIFNTPLGIYYTNMEVKVKELSICTEKIKVPTLYTKFAKDTCLMNDMELVEMKYYLVNDSFGIVHEDSDKNFKAICNQLKENCKKFGWNWQGYYWFKEQFADVKYNHAITIHKSQGSTYKRAIINIEDVTRRCHDENDRERLLYTAITRASDLVILNQVR